MFDLAVIFVIVLALHRKAGAVDPLELAAINSPSHYVRTVYRASVGESIAMTCSFHNLQHSLGYVVQSLNGVTGRQIVWYTVDNHGTHERIAIGSEVEQKVRAFYDYKIIFTDSTTSVLYINRVKKSNAGYFKCVLSHGGPIHQIVYLNVTDNKLVTYHPFKTVYKVQTGAVVTLTCNVTSSSPPPLIYWTRGLRRVSSDTQAVAWGPILKLHDVEKVDEGIYMCQVDNFISLPERLQFKVIVETLNERSRVKPISIIALYDSKPKGLHMKPHPGRMYTLSCRSNAFPKVTFSWFKNGKLINQFFEPNLSIHQSQRKHWGVLSELIIRKFEDRDNGVYACQAYNRRERKFYQFKLQTKKKKEPIDDEDSSPGYSGNGWEGSGAISSTEEQEQNDFASGSGAVSTSDAPRYKTNSVSNFSERN